MVSILLKDCSWILTMNPPDKVLKNVSIYIEDSFIVEIGPAKPEAEYVIDCRGCAVMPGLVNLHTHAAMSLLRGYADDMPLDVWLKEKIWPIEEKMRAEDVYIGSLLSCVEMVKAGITCFVDMYWFSEEVCKAASKVGIRALVTCGTLDLGQPERAEKEIERVKKFLEFVKGLKDPKIKAGIGPHAPYTCSKDFLEKLRSIAEKEKVPIHIHVAETQEEQTKFEKEQGMREVEYLEKLGLLGPDVIMAHCIWLSKEELDIMAKYGVKVAHCPIANMKIGQGGVAPIPEMLRKGIKVGLGTDGPASNNDLDLLETMKFAALLHKLHLRNPAIMRAQDVLVMATRNGYEAVGFEGVKGVVEEGVKADIIVIDMRKARFTPVHEVSTVLSHLVYVAKGNDVRDVIVDGKVVVKDGKVVTVNEEDVLNLAQKTALDLVTRR
ncbi:MAG: N-ethylammeline chlorohydrolase [Thermoprotei archaeon]|nr:MAG: N-ethylammeline chlorohydrolase [Thermoprotei archaeon]